MFEIAPSEVALVGGATQQFTESPDQNVGWSLMRGHGSVDDAGFYVAPNRTGSDTLVGLAIFDGSVAESSIEVVGIFPLVPSYGTASGSSKETRVNALQGGGRIAAPGSGAYLRFTLSGNNATADEISALADFHAWHHPALSFYVMDYRLNRTILCKFDGDAEWKQVSFDSFDWSVPLRTFSFSAGFGGDLNSPFGA